MRRRTLQEELKQSKPFETPADEALVALMRTASLVRRAIARRVEPHGISVAQYNVLRILRGAGTDGLPSAEIGLRMVTRVPDVTRLVDRLESAGLVERTRSESDRRVVLVRIGKKGLELLAGIDEPMKRMPDKLMGGLGAAELRKLNDLLVRLRGAQD